MLKILQTWYARHKLLCRSIAGVVIFYILVGFVAAPLVVRHILENQVSAALHRDVRAAAVRTNPLTFSLRLAGLVISGMDNDAAFVRIDRLDINVDPLTSLFKRGVVIQSIDINKPWVRIARTDSHRFNFSDLLVPSPPNSGTKTGPEAKPVRLVMGELKIVSGEIHYADNTLGVPFETTIKSLDAAMNGLDTRPEANAFHYTVGGGTETDEQFELRGQCQIHPVAVEARITFKNVAPAKYAPYYQSYINTKLAQGRIDLHAGLKWDEQTRAIAGLQIRVQDLVLKTEENPKDLVNLPRCVVEDAGIDFKNRQIRLGRINSRDARIFIQRDDRGQLNLQTAFAPRPSTASAHYAAGKETPPAPQAPRAPRWNVVLPQLNLNNYAIEFEDLLPSTPVRTRLHGIALAAENLSTWPQEQGKIDLKLDWADQGTLSANGDVGLHRPCRRVWRYRSTSWISGRCNPMPGNL